MIIGVNFHVLPNLYSAKGPDTVEDTALRKFHLYFIATALELLLLLF